MKTPRELLLNRHQSANARLDRIRQKVLKAEVRDATPTAAVMGWRALLSTLNARLSAILWPSPRAWGGLAATWLVILAVHFAIRDEPRQEARMASPPSPELLATLREQQQLLAELIGPADVRAAAPPRRFSPGPRSESRHEIMTA